MPTCVSSRRKSAHARVGGNDDCMWWCFANPTVSLLADAEIARRTTSNTALSAPAHRSFDDIRGSLGVFQTERNYEAEAHREKRTADCH